MSIRGELVQAAKQALEAQLPGHNINAGDLVQAILDAAADPNWAQRFDDDSGWDQAMPVYFDVIRFLKDFA
jgi:hypothetical protein